MNFTSLTKKIRAPPPLQKNTFAGKLKCKYFRPVFFVSHVFPTRGSHVLSHRTWEEEASGGFKGDGNRIFHDFCPQEKSYYTWKKWKNSTLKKYTQKERLPGLCMPTLYLIQQQSRKKDPSPERPSSGRPMWKSISLCRTSINSSPFKRGAW